MIRWLFLKVNDIKKEIFLGVSPLGSGFTGLRYRFGASTSLTAAPTIPNALRHSNALPQYFFINGGLTPLPIACNNLIFNPSGVRNPRRVRYNVRSITYNIRKISKNAQNTFAICRH